MKLQDFESVKGFASANLMRDYIESKVTGSSTDSDVFMVLHCSVLQLVRAQDFSKTLFLSQSLVSKC